MDSLNAAFERLGKAVDRLERAAVAREERAGRRERELNEALWDARAERNRAQESADAVSKRLEEAIGRLETVLEN